MSRISNNSFAVNSNLEQKIDIASVSASGVPISGTVDVDVTANSVGLATSSLQTTGNSSLATIAGAVSGTELQCDVVTSALPSGAATSANQSTMISSLGTIAGAVSGSEVQCDVVSSALPTGASTSALQTTGNTSLSTIAGDTTSMDGKISQGYDASIASGGSGLQQVLLYARDASGNLDALEVNGSGELKVSSSGGGGGGTHSGSQANLFNASSVVSGDTSSVITTTSSANITIFGNTTDTGNQIDVEISADNSNFYPLPYGIFPDSSGNFAEKFSEVSNYWRIKVGGSATITATLLHNT